MDSAQAHSERLFFEMITNIYPRAILSVRRRSYRRGATAQLYLHLTKRPNKHIPTILDPRSRAMVNRETDRCLNLVPLRSPRREA